MGRADILRTTRSCSTGSDTAIEEISLRLLECGLSVERAAKIPAGDAHKVWSIGVQQEQSANTLRHPPLVTERWCRSQYSKDCKRSLTVPTINPPQGQSPGSSGPKANSVFENYYHVHEARPISSQVGPYLDLLKEGPTSRKPRPVNEYYHHHIYQCAPALCPRIIVDWLCSAHLKTASDKACNTTNESTSVLFRIRLLSARQPYITCFKKHIGSCTFLSWSLHIALSATYLKGFNLYNWRTHLFEVKINEMFHEKYISSV